MKTIVILSGKGGTGKTTFSSNLSLLLSKIKNITIADCDADAPNLGLALGIRENEFINWEEIETNEKAVLNETKCDGCKKCLNTCNFGAITWDKVHNKPVFNSMLCEGCGACELICPKKAISLVKVKNGKIASLKTKYGFDLISGQLNIGATGSGKIVSLIKEQAKKIAKEEHSDFIIVDSAAGVGCPVIASIQGSDFVIAVTEPTPSGLSDLKRALRTVEQFGIPYGIVINRHNLNKEFTKKIEEFMNEYKIPLLGKIPYNKKFVEALVNMTPITEIYPEYKSFFENTIKFICDEEKVHSLGYD